MKNPRLMTATGIPEAMSNLCYHGGSKVMDIYDAVEDSSTAQELVQNLNRLNIFRPFRLDRETDKYVRLKVEDCLGNASYLTADKE